MEVLTIGQKIRKRRKELGMTLKELAGDRVTAGQLSFVELDKSHPSSELMQYIAGRLRISMEYLLETEKSQALKICNYNLKLTEACIYDKRYEDAGFLLDECKSIASMYELMDILGKVEMYKGNIAFVKEDYKKASEFFLNANAFFFKSEDYSGVIDTYVLLGETSYKDGFYNLSISYFRQAEDLGSQWGLCDDELKARIYFNLFRCLTKYGSYDEADKYLPLVEDYMKSIKCKESYGESLVDISFSYRDAANYDKALYYACKAVDIFRDIENSSSLTKMEMYIGTIYAYKNDIEKSNFYLKSCEAHSKSLGDYDLIQLYQRLAKNCMEENKFGDAVGYIEKSYNLSVKNRYTDCQLNCYKCLYKVYLKSKDYYECEKILKQQLSLLESLDRPSELVECHMCIGEFYKLIDKKELAMDYISRGFKMLEQMREKFDDQP
jgi:tetratricopeptide (TPR) repeat protein